MGEMEELRKEADNLKEQITVSPDPPVAITDFVFVPPPLPHGQTYHKLDQARSTGPLTCCLFGCFAGSPEGGARHHAAGSGGGADRGRPRSDENQKNAEGSPCQDLRHALGG